MEKDYSELELLFHQIMANMKVKLFIMLSLPDSVCRGIVLGLSIS